MRCLLLFLLSSFCSLSPLNAFPYASVETGIYYVNHIDSVSHYASSGPALAFRVTPPLGLQWKGTIGGREHSFHSFYFCNHYLSYLFPVGADWAGGPLAYGEIRNSPPPPQREREGVSRYDLLVGGGMQFKKIGQRGNLSWFNLLFLEERGFLVNDTGMGTPGPTSLCRNAGYLVGIGTTSPLHNHFQSEMEWQYIGSFHGGGREVRGSLTLCFCF